MSTLSTITILVVGDLSFTSQANAGVRNNKQKINRCVNALKLIVQYRINVNKVFQLSQFPLDGGLSILIIGSAAFWC